MTFPQNFFEFPAKLKKLPRKKSEILPLHFSIFPEEKLFIALNADKVADIRQKKTLVLNLA